MLGKREEDWEDLLEAKAKDREEFIEARNELRAIAESRAQKLLVMENKCNVRCALEFFRAQVIVSVHIFFVPLFYLILDFLLVSDNRFYQRIRQLTLQNP